MGIYDDLRALNYSFDEDLLSYGEGKPTLYIYIYFKKLHFKICSNFHVVFLAHGNHFGRRTIKFYNVLYRRTSFPSVLVN